MVTPIVNEPDYDLLIKNLSEKNKATVEAAKAQLKLLTPAQLVALVESDVAKRNRRQKQGARLQLTAYGLLAYFLIPKHGMLQQLNLVVAILYCLCMGVGMKLTWPDLRVRKAVAETIEQSEDTAFVPAALELLSRSGNIRKYFTRTQSWPAEASLRIALRRLMPRLRPGQLDTWTIQQRNALLVPLIEPTFDIELTLCVLKALEQVGGEWAVPVVEKLTKLKGKGPEARIKTAAEECLPTLQEIAEEERRSGTLLRPVLTAEDQAAILLRPAVGTTAVAEPLLRAVE
jgi:hypothetical protein